MKISFILLLWFQVGLLRADSMVLMPASQVFGLDNASGSARAQAMGSASVALAGDASAVFTNPAGLAGVGVTELSAHHNAWLVDTWQESAVLGLPLGRGTGMAIFGNYVDYGNFEGRDASGNPTFPFKAYRLGGGFGWGREVAPGLSAGIAVKGSEQA